MFVSKNFLIFCVVIFLKCEGIMLDVQKDVYNYVLGTQSFSPSYKFTNLSALDETSNVILDLGSNLIKFKQIDDPDMKVLDKLFQTVFLWWRSSSDLWYNGMSEKAKEEEYNATYSYVASLLKRYSGSGRTFFLGHWEGDWYLLPGYNTSIIPTDINIQGMRDWLNVRQKAVDDAKRNTPHVNVFVWQYTEVNRVRDAMIGLKRLANYVLPYVNVDYVSYSSYDMQDLSQDEINRTVQYVRSQLKKTDPESRVFIGEFGIPAQKVNYDPTQHELVNRRIIIKYLKCHVPFVLFWEVYNNEVRDGKQLGFWLVNDKNVKQPLYFTFQKLYINGKEFVANFVKTKGRYPTISEYSEWAANFLQNL